MRYYYVKDLDTNFVWRFNNLGSALVFVFAHTDMFKTLTSKRV